MAQVSLFLKRIRKINIQNPGRELDHFGYVNTVESGLLTASLTDINEIDIGPESQVIIFCCTNRNDNIDLRQWIFKTEPQRCELCSEHRRSHFEYFSRFSKWSRNLKVILIFFIINFWLSLGQPLHLSFDSAKVPASGIFSWFRLAL